MASHSSRRTSTADAPKIRLGFIGTAGRGYGALMHEFKTMPDVETVAVCDVHPPHLDQAVALTAGTAKAYRDYRDLLADKTVDAVVIATPPHWHAIMAIDAMKAGKDVYCEKPMSLHAVEAERMARAAAKYGRVTQVGTQVHATPNFRRCVEIVRAGKLGTITAVHNLCTMNDHSEGLGYPADEPAPAGLDWNAWLGPAPKAPFNSGRFRDGMHRYFKDYIGSWLHELGPHIVDLPFWALELEAPLTVSASGGRFATNSIADIPDTMMVTWTFPKLVMTWTLQQANAFNFGIGKPGSGRQIGITFHGDAATLLANYSVCEVIDSAGKPIPTDDVPATVPVSPGHGREFIENIKTRQECSCSFRRHLPLHLALNLAHVALETGRTLHWNAEKGEVTGDKAANKLIKPNYREPYKLPKV